MITYAPTSFSQGRMDFAWEELTDAQHAQAYADWEAGKGLIGGNPLQRPGSNLLPTWGVDLPFFRTLALGDERGRNGDVLRTQLAVLRPLEVEIGFGRGDFLLDRAQRHPDRFFIGYETKTKATRLMLARIERQHQQVTEHELNNINPDQAATQSLDQFNLWLSDDDARFSLPRVLDGGSVAIFHVLFPDPWWKNEHKVKRLFSPPFVDLLASRLQSGGLLHFKSDVQEYGELVCYLVENHPDFSAHDPALATLIGAVAPTHREHWCSVHGKPVWTYYFARK